MKRCSKCKEYKSRSEFYINKATKDGLQSLCKQCICSDKQRRTLLLFAQNYSIRIIAEEMGVSERTIKERLRNLALRHRPEFIRALNIREVYKLERNAIRNVTVFSNLGMRDLDGEPCTAIEIISLQTKKRF